MKTYICGLITGIFLGLSLFIGGGLAYKYASEVEISNQPQSIASLAETSNN